MQLNLYQCSQNTNEGLESRIVSLKDFLSTGDQYYSDHCSLKLLQTLSFLTH